MTKAVRIRPASAALFWICAFGAPVQAQFSSGSNGSDGALNLSGQPVIEFDPTTLSLDPDEDNIYHFTTINIPAGVRVRLTARKLSGPVYWLASGPVQIDGIIDLDGQDGHAEGSSLAPVPSIAGAGGYSGGVGRPRGESGFGPGGGRAGYCERFSCFRANAGSFTGNPFLVPLIGGSGGAGGLSGGEPARGGGAGGGAILIASSNQMTITGTITARGGAGQQQDNGSRTDGAAGAIRLAANKIILAASARLEAAMVRLEAFEKVVNGTIAGSQRLASPYNLFLPSPTASSAASIRVVSIDGVAVPEAPNGSFEVPDVVINKNVPVNVEIAAHNVMLGTRATLYLRSEDGPSQNVQSTELAGTFAQSNATVTLTIPPGYSRGYVRAYWTPTP